MKIIYLQGGNRLCGNVKIHAAKNAILPILAAAILSSSPITLYNCPRLRDIDNMLGILEHMGCKTDIRQDSITIDPSDAQGYEMPDKLAKQVRSSIFMLGSILGRFKKAKLTYPGGCEIGQRPINLHLKALREMGAVIDEVNGYLVCSCDKLKGCDIYLDYPSVGATENVMLAAATAEGVTRIFNPAKEPEIVDLANFINKMGGKVTGAGSIVITIEGVEQLQGCEYTPICDRIVAGTYLLAGAITGGNIKVEVSDPEHIRALICKLEECGCTIEIEPNAVTIDAPERLISASQISTLPYPGFPTDMQSQMMTLQSVCKGTCIMIENVFENRFKHAAELIKMGADITIKDRMAIIKGVDTLYGANVESHDLRSGAALILAGLQAKGITRITDANYINRGYYKLEETLAGLGARIEYTEE